MKKLVYIIPEAVICAIPTNIASRVEILAEQRVICAEEINEIRIRVGQPASVTCGQENIVLHETVSQDALSECVSKLCCGSVYAHSETIRKGYIQAPNGIRVGVCGTLAPDGRAVRDISSVNIRIPHIIRGVCAPVLRICREEGGRIRSVLIYSSPGVGKTTLLRDLASSLGGKYKIRTAIIDTRGELYIPAMFSDTLCDVLTGYERAEGIEIATRTLSPQLIICDELGNMDESRQLLAAVGAGVPVIASAHASDIAELMRRTNIRLLHDAGVFDGYAGITRECINGKYTRNYICKYTPRDEVSAEMLL